MYKIKNYQAPYVRDLQGFLCFFRSPHVIDGGRVRRVRSFHSLEPAHPTHLKFYGRQCSLSLLVASPLACDPSAFVPFNKLK